MSTLTQLYGGGARVIAMPGGFGTWTNGLGVISPAIITASGAMTSGTWKDLLSVTNAQGALKLLAARTNNATSKTLAIRVTRDGVVIFDSTSATIATSSAGICIYGAVYGSTNYAASDGSDLMFDTSLRIEFKSSVSETDGFNLYVNYDLRG